MPALANGDPQRCGKDWWCPQQTISQMEDFDNSKSHSVKFSNQSASFVHDRILLFDSMIVGEREIDNLSLATMIANIMNKPLIHKMVDFHSSRPGHDLRYALDGSKLQAMGWQMEKNLEKSLETVITWSLENESWLMI